MDGKRSMSGALNSLFLRARLALKLICLLRHRATLDLKQNKLSSGNLWNRRKHQCQAAEAGRKRFLEKINLRMASYRRYAVIERRGESCGSPAHAHSKLDWRYVPKLFILCFLIYLRFACAFVKMLFTAFLSFLCQVSLELAIINYSWRLLCLLPAFRSQIDIFYSLGFTHAGLPLYRGTVCSVAKHCDTNGYSSVACVCKISRGFKQLG